MSDVVKDDEVEGGGALGPGSRLRAAREAQNLGISRVAAQLHLSEEMVLALEENDAERLPEPVFVQGYLRNYARLLGLPVDSVVEAYRAASPVQRSQPSLVISHTRPEIHSSHGLVRFITWVIAIGLVILLVSWWRGYLQWPLQLAVAPADEHGRPLQGGDVSPADSGGPGFTLPPMRESVESGEVAETPPGIDPDRQPAGDEIVSFGSAGVTEAGNTPPAADPAGEREPAPEEAPAAEEPPSSTEEGLAVDDAQRPVAATVVAEIAPAPVRETEPAAVAIQGIEVDFKENCWTDIKDATGRYRIFGEKKAGTHYLLEGSPPYTFILGNAEAVRVKVNGESFDLAPHTTRNIARFTLDPR